MKQLTQQLKSGKMEIIEAPFPALNKGQILVRNHYSVISAGTEGKTVTDARKGYISKAKSRKKEVKAVIEMVKKNGLMSTYKLVMNKLEAPSALGYSTAGEVIAVGEGVTKFNVGDRVACGGKSANHADVIAVSVNLCVKIPENVDLRYAAFSTLASIAIQGIRQSEMQMGENCLIIGMGIIGQLTYKILEASGMYPIGVDISDVQVQQSKDAGIDNVYNRNQPGIEQIISDFSNGYGSDSVIITAGTSSLDPIEFAGAMARQKANVTIVGAVPTGFSRTHYYKKELNLKMSMSYGPGRSDINYEEKGIDYPIGYVRWTENRNMKSFIDLLASNRLDISKLISHNYTLNNAYKAYDMILARKVPFSGILIQYDFKSKLIRNVELSTSFFDKEDANVGLIGAGSFAQGTLIPNMKGYCNFIGIASGSGNTSKYVGDKYGFNYLAAKSDEIFDDEKINTIFITTRHNLHAEYVLNSIKSNKNVFVEKPLAMNEDELSQIKKEYDEAVSSGKAKKIMVGFNRRFSPAVNDLKGFFNSKQTKSIAIRVNAGVVPPEHWVNDPEIGGGRIIGEVCHFIDLAMFIADSEITSVSADTVKDSNNLNNTVIINLKMKNGSIASINYFSNGNGFVPKEQIEVFSGGAIAQINDFRSLTFFNQNKKMINYGKQDKGHAKCVRTFLNSIRNGNINPIPFNQLWMSTMATFKVIQSIKENRKILIS